jgi:tRNA1(Val) A37 N6-methylase TrmN6
MQVTENAYLDGRLMITQPARGYRAGVDPVLLAASVPAKSGQSILELGCGVGTAILCLGARVANLSLTAVELQPDHAELARQNALRNSATLDVHCADLTALPADLRQQSFDHVIANPPYFLRGQGNKSDLDHRETAMGEDTPLVDWVHAAAKRLKPKGYASFIHRAERLPDLIAAVSTCLGSIQVLPLQPRIGRDAQLVLLRARKEGRASFRLHAPLLMHQGIQHDRDAESYTPQISAVLRDGATLPFPD